MEPRPHYCHHPRGEGDRAGCPNWPMCLFADAGPPPVVDVTPDPLLLALQNAGPQSPTLARDLATLGGWAVGGVLLVVVAVLLIRIWP